MEQTPYGQRGPAAEILRLIQREGPQSIKALEGQLGVSANAVREQIQHLLAEGLVSASTQRRGAGRPAHVYALTQKAHGLFPQRHDLLLRMLIQEIAKEDGSQRAQDLLNAVGERLADDVAGGVAGGDLHQRLQATVTALGQRGMPIAVHEQEDLLTLHARSCPYLSIARDHPGICAMEQHMLERALDAKVTLEARLVDGHTSCRFMVQENESSAAV